MCVSRDRTSESNRQKVFKINKTIIIYYLKINPL